MSAFFNEQLVKTKKLGVVTGSEKSAMSKFQSCMAVKPISTLSKLYIHSTRDYSSKEGVNAPTLLHICDKFIIHKARVMFVLVGFFLDKVCPSIPGKG
jgi:hypothetical protein